MLRNLWLHRVLWPVTGQLALVGAVTGVAVPGIYAVVVAPDVVPGAFSQDIISVAASVLLMAAAPEGGNEPAKGQIVALRVLGLPAFLSHRSHPLGLLLLPALYIFGFTLIFPLAPGEMAKPLFGLTADAQSFWLSLGLSLVFAVLGGFHLLKLALVPRPGESVPQAANTRPTGSTPAG